jgi:hypothetical protein
LAVAAFVLAYAAETRREKPAPPEPRIEVPCGFIAAGRVRERAFSDVSVQSTCR